MAKRKPDEPEISLIDFQPTTGVDIPRQTEFYKLPTRLSPVPLDKMPLGWEVGTRRRENKVTKFEYAYLRDKKARKKKIARSVQDRKGGEKTLILERDVK